MTSWYAVHFHLARCADASVPSTSAPQRPPAPWLSAAVSAGYLPCLERFTRTMAWPGYGYPGTPEERAEAVLELMQGRLLAALSSGVGEERQAGALVATAVKAAAVWTYEDGCLWRAVEWFTDIPDALVDWALVLHREEQAVGSGEPAAEGEEETEEEKQQQQQQQQEQQQVQQRGQLLRILSLCMARWLPVYPVLFQKAMDEARLGEGVGVEAGVGLEVGSEKRRLVMLLRSGYRMVRLAGLARGAAEGRGGARAAESWGRLLAASTGTPADEHGQGHGEEEKTWNKGLDGLAPLLPPPCDVVRTVLPLCSNPFCVNLEGDSEAGLQLVACEGRCGGVACGGEGPCCCGRCARKGDWKAAW